MTMLPTSASTTSPRSLTNPPQRQCRIMAFHTLKWFAVTQILLMMAACQPMMHWVSGASLAKTHDRTISMITAGVIGIGILLQIGAFFIDENKGGLMMYLAFALVSTGLLLSFLPSHLTGSTPKKTA